MFLSGVANGVAGLRLRLVICSSVSAVSIPSTGSRTTACTSLPTIMRASDAAVSLRGSQCATTLPWRITVAASHMRKFMCEHGIEAISVPLAP